MNNTNPMKEFVRTIVDYPVKGIQFRDITTLLQNAGHFKQVIDEMTNPWKELDIDAVLSIESRGFIMAGAIAYNIGAAFIPFRKPDKLPGDTYKVSYDLEYGSTEMHVHKDALDNHKNLLIIDDLLATGGTASAAIQLLQKTGTNVSAFLTLIELSNLKGRDRIKVQTESLLSFDE